MRLNLYKLKLTEEKQAALYKERGFNYVAENTETSLFTHPKKFVDMMNTLFQLNEQAEEYAYLLALNSKNKPIGLFEISHGCLDQTIINPREVFMKALLCGATCIMICHNHPSGDPSPSKADIEVTTRILEAGKLLGMPLLDHVVIGGDKYISFSMEKLM